MTISVRDLMLAGAHFGHRVRFSNPKMSPYIYGKYRSTHIINLDHTVEALERAAEFLKSVAESDGKVLYVCTKQASETIEEEAKSVGMPFVNRRWLGGILTNFKTTRNSVDRLEKIEQSIAEGALKNMTKKEGLRLLLMQEKLERAIGGIRTMNELPDALFIVDAGWHKGAVREANKLGIPIAAVVDTNHSPENIDYVIPGNDDSREAVAIYVREMTAAIAAGKAAWEANLVAEVGGGVADMNAGADTAKVISARRNKSSAGGSGEVIVEEKPKKRIITAKKKPAEPATPSPVAKDKEDA